MDLASALCAIVAPAPSFHDGMGQDEWLANWLCWANPSAADQDAKECDGQYQTWPHLGAVNVSTTHISSLASLPAFSFVHV